MGVSVKKMRWMAIGAAAVLLGGCSNGPKKTVSLYDRGLEIVKRMDTMAETEEYAKIMTSSQEILDIIKEIGAGDYSQPKAVYEVKLSEASAEMLFSSFGGSMDALSQELKGELLYRMTSSIPTMFSAMAGAETLAAISLITADDYFIEESVSGNLLYFYIYDSECCGAVVFSGHEDGIVSAKGAMIKNEALRQVSDLEEITQWLAENAGLMGVEIKEVSP